MSSGDCIIISSDDDSDVITVSEKTEVIKPANTIKKLITKKSHMQKKNENKNNQDSSLNLKDNLLVKTAKVQGTKIPNPLNNCIQTGLDSKNSSESSETVENNFQDYLSVTYQKFVSTVLSLEPEEEDKTKLLKKLNKYHNLADPEYIKSNDFNSLLENGLEKINDNPVYLYFVLKEVRDCLFSKRVEIKLKKKCSSKILSLAGSSGTLKNGGEGTFEDKNYEDLAADEKNYKTVKKLTRLLQKLAKTIKKLEESEVDFSDEEGSNYFKMQRYRERYCRVYKKLCTYTTHPLNANRIGAFRKINFAGTPNLELNRAVEKWLNKERRFPDYPDMLKLIEGLNESLPLGLSNDQIKLQAEAIFKKIGDMLQRRRHFDLWESLSSFLEEEVDPAIKDPELRSKLQKNFDLGVQKEKEIFRYYVEQQEKEKLNPIEVPDEDADISPVESGDEDEKEIAEVENILSTAIKGEDELTEESYEYETEIEEKEVLLDCKEENGIADGNSKLESGVLETRKAPDSVMNTEKIEGMVENNKESTFVEKSVCASTSETATKELTCKKGDSVAADKNDTCSVSNNICKKIENETVENANGKISSVSDEIKISTLNLVKNIPNSDLEVICSIPNRSCKHNNSIRSEHLNAINTIKRENETPQLKRSLVLERGFHCVKKNKLEMKIENTSDTEIVEILSDDEENYVAEEKNVRTVVQKAHQVNYAFVKNNLNYNAVLSWDLFGEKNFFFRDLKRKKNRRKSPNRYTLTDLTNIKNIENKFNSSKEIKLKRKRKSTPGISKRPCSIKRLACERQRLKKSKIILLLKNNNNCPLQNGTSSESIKCQKEPDNISDNNSLQQGSSEEPMRSPNNGSSGGGNGQDNGENNGNKKPYEQEKQIEDNQDEDDEDEDKETDKELEKEGSKENIETSFPSVKEDGQELNCVPSAVPENCFAPNNLYLNEENAKNELKKNLPSTYETVDENIEKVKESKVQLAPVIKTTRSRKRVNNQFSIDKNGGIPGTSRQDFINMFSDVKFRKHSSTAGGTVRKRSLNIPSPSSAGNASKIKASEKRYNLPVKTTQSDEEIVKNFLEGSHPSISITSPRKKTIQNEFSPSPSVLEAMATLSRLKGISATIVKGSSKRKSDEDVTVIGESLNTRVNQMSKLKKAPKSAKPIENFDCVIPKIVTVHGNVSGFENMTNDSISDNEMMYQGCVQNPEFCKINAAGNKSTNFNQVNSAVNDIPIPRFRNVQSRTRHKNPKNAAKKNVEYVVLD